MNAIEILSKNEEQTRTLGSQLGRAIQQPCIIFLEGTLGAGKTRLSQAIAAGLDIDPDTVNSPTFTIMVPHTGRLTLLHVDAYRIKDLDEADQLGIDDWVASGCVLLVEWAERIEDILPTPDLKIKIEHETDVQRQFNITANTPLGEKLIHAIQ